MPWATSKGEDYKAQLESRDELSAISPGTFKESSNAERVYFIESFDALGESVKNIFVQSMHQQKLGIIVAAKGSRYVEENGDKFLLMKNGMENIKIKMCLKVFMFLLLKQKMLMVKVSEGMDT